QLRPRTAPGKTSTVAMETKIVEALQNGDSERLQQLCRQLESNPTVTLEGFDADAEPPAQSVAHQLACRSRSAKALSALLRQVGPGCLASRNACGDTPLHCAARYQTDAWLQLICDRLQLDDVDFDVAAAFRQPGRSRRTPAHSAAQNRRSNSALRWLVRHCGSGCLADTDEFGFTAVHLAAWHQGVNSMELLRDVLGGTACFLQQGRCGRTAVHCAAVNPNGNSTLKWLIKECGRACLEIEDSYGDTVLHLAARHQPGTEAMRLAQRELGTAGSFACFRRRGRWKRTVVHSAATNPKDNLALKWLARQSGRDCLAAVDKFGNSPVHLAAWKQGTDSMELMTRSLGPDCFLQQDQWDRTAVHWAAMNRGGNSVLRWLVAQLGPDCLKQPNSFGNTPVHLAAWKQGADSMELMKNELGSECFSWLGQCGRSVVHKAALNQASCEALKWLVEQLGSDRLREKDNQGNSAAHLAAWKQGEESLSFIVDKIGTKMFKERGNFDWTAAHMAAQNSGSALAWCINELGPDCLKAKDLRGRTPAHLAARHLGAASLSLIKDSLGAAAFDNLKDFDGRTVADYAAESGDEAEWMLGWIVEQQEEEEQTRKSHSQ
ncbi:hypothetical protein BOX15_Mlig004931g3, partial [Macrostomum lignano]